MKTHTKKKIAPIVIVTLLLAYHGGLLCGCLFLPLPWFIKTVGAAVLATLGGLFIYVLVQRINEIRSGEEDDLSNY